VAAASGIRVLHTPGHALRANATCERFLGSVRRECLDHPLVLGEAHVRRVLREYMGCFKRARPHQALGQAVPARFATAGGQRAERGSVIAILIPGGLHHNYRRAT
jgi:transposase InsO family protein